MEELSNSGIIGSLAEELGHRDIIVFEELCDGGIQIAWHVHLTLIQVSWYNLVEELSDRDVIGFEVFGYSNVI